MTAHLLAIPSSASVHRVIAIACLVAAVLLPTGCEGELLGGDETAASAVEVVSADDLARGAFNTGLLAGDEEGELVGEPSDASEMAGYIDPEEEPAEAPPDSGAGSVSEPGEWLAETASGQASLVRVQQLIIEPYTDLIPGDTTVATLIVEAKAQDLSGAEARVEMLAPTGVRLVLSQRFDLPADALGYVHLATPPLPVEGTYVFRPSVHNAAGEVLSQGLELEVQVAAARLPMATSSLASIMRQAAKFRYSSGCSNRTCLAKKGRGDCWAMSDWLWAKLEGAKINARIIQYRTKYSSRHRSVQYVSGGRWKDVPYKTYGVSTLFRTTASRPGLFVYRN